MNTMEVTPLISAVSFTLHVNGSSNPFEGLLEIGDDILDVFSPDRQS